MAKRKSAFQERFIKPETIHIGDTIKATWTRSDLVGSAIGSVASIDADGPTRTFRTAWGEVIFTYIPGGVNKIRVTLLDPAPSRADAALFDLEKGVMVRGH